MKRRILFVLAVALLLVVNFSLAETNADRMSVAQEYEQKTKPALKENIVGEWEMIWQLNAGAIPKDDPFVAPYHLFYFSDNNGMVVMGSTKPFDEIAAATWQSAKKEPRAIYEFRKPGVCLIKNSDGSQYYMIVSWVAEDLTNSLRPDAPSLKGGDIMLSYSGDKGVYLVRYLRRVVSK